MIQRVQSIYLLLTILFSTGLLIYSRQLELSSDISLYGGYFFSPVLALLTLLLFKKRVLQARLCVVLIIFQIFLIGYYGYHFLNDTIFETTYPSLVLGTFHLVLVSLARRSILKDEALVRSVDRIR